MTVRWGDYAPGEIEGDDGKPIPVWQRHSAPRPLTIALGASNGDSACHDVAGSGGLELQVVERPVPGQDLAGASSHRARDRSRSSS